MIGTFKSNDHFILVVLLTKSRLVYTIEPQFESSARTL